MLSSSKHISLSRVHEPTTVPGDELPAPEVARSQEFHSFLTLGILTSRWLRPYATPCQARGATV